MFSQSAMPNAKCNQHEMQEYDADYQTIFASTGWHLTYYPSRTLAYAIVIMSNLVSIKA